MPETKNIQYGSGTHDFDDKITVKDILTVDTSTEGIVTLNSTGDDTFAYSFKQQGIDKLTIQKDGSASLPDCIDDDITDQNDIMTLSKSFQVAGRYRTSGELTTASITLLKTDNGRFYEITADSAIITITLDANVITESWFDFDITDSVAPIKQITMINGTQTISVPAVTGSFRIFKWADNDTRLIKYTGDGSDSGEAVGELDTIQTTDGNGAFKISNAKIYEETSNCHLKLGDPAARNGILEAEGSVAIIIDSESTSTTDAFYVRSRSNSGLDVLKIEQAEHTTAGGIATLPQSTIAKIGAVATGREKSIITREYLDAKVINTKTIFVENPVDADYIPIFQNLTGATITIQEISGTKSATGNMDVRLYKGTVFAFVSGTALDIQNVTLTGTSTVYRTPEAPNTVADDEWVYLYIQGGVNSSCSVNIRYTIG